MDKILKVGEEEWRERERSGMKFCASRLKKKNKINLDILGKRTSDKI